MNNFKQLFIDKLISRKDDCRPAICIANVYYSYKNLLQRISYINFLLSDIDDEIIGLYTTDDVMSYSAIISLWMNGKSYVPLNPSHPKERHLEIAASVGLRYIISSDSAYSLNEKSIILTDKFTENECGNERLRITKDIDDSQLAYILFTSGSTGRPKGVQITKGNLAAFIDSMNNIGLAITENDRCLQPFDLTFDFSVSSYLIPLLKGACFYTIPNRAVKFTSIVDLLDNYKLTVLQMVPSMIRNLLPYMDEIDISSVRYNILCGEALFSDTIKKWHKWNVNMVSYNMYGPTEDTVFCTDYVIDSTNINSLSESNGIVGIGKTFKNNELMLVNEKGEIIFDPYLEGELCLSGRQLTPGYWDNDKENAEKFFVYEGKRFYRSGDLCFFDNEGNLLYVSRKDSQVKINGFRVELGEIENKFKDITGKFAVVVPVTNHQGNIELAIVIEGKDYDYMDDKSKLASSIPNYELPSIWKFIKAIPLNQNSKIDRKKLIEYVIIENNG